MSKTTRLPGRAAKYYHVNSAKCGSVNDRLRRRAKRLERVTVKRQIAEETQGRA